MTSNFRKSAPHNQLDIELMRIGNPAVFRDVPKLLPLDDLRPISCVICGVLGRKLIALGKWFELRAQAYQQYVPKAQPADPAKVSSLN